MRRRAPSGPPRARASPCPRRASPTANAPRSLESAVPTTVTPGPLQREASILLELPEGDPGSTSATSAHRTHSGRPRATRRWSSVSRVQAEATAHASLRDHGRRPRVRINAAAELCGCCMRRSFMLRRRCQSGESAHPPPTARARGGAAAGAPRRQFDAAGVRLRRARRRGHRARASCRRNRATPRSPAARFRTRRGATRRAAGALAPTTMAARRRPTSGGRVARFSPTSRLDAALAADAVALGTNSSSRTTSTTSKATTPTPTSRRSRRLGSPSTGSSLDRGRATSRCRRRRTSPSRHLSTRPTRRGSSSPPTPTAATPRRTGERTPKTAWCRAGGGGR